MIQADRLTKSYGGRTVLRELSWRIGPRDRVGLVGPNGVGKTTLCRILAGVESADAGRVSRPRDAEIGYLPQEAGSAAEGTVLDEVLAGFEDVWRLERELHALAVDLERAPSEALTARYGDLQHRFEALGGYRLEREATAILSGLGFAAVDVTRPLAEFSGGWRMRAALARLLLQAPALLLLDEPTNHLDLPSLAWLESFLASYPGAVVVVSHDRYFLNRMVDSIAELSESELTLYPGDWDAYLVERQARRELLEARARNRAKRVAEIERFIERFRYKATKARQVQSRVKMLARMERIDVAADARRIRFAFPEPPRTGRRVVTLGAIHKAYGDHVVYAGIDLALERGERIALVGDNGAGKSTLLKILAGTLPPDRGDRVLGPHVTVHYYAQHQLEALEPWRTALEEMIAVAPQLPHTRLRTILGAFLFSGDAVDKKVAVLSGGEKARLALARMLVQRAALLCLDEPTNHLDLASREVLEQALAGFAGTLVFISHDRYFINRMATSVIHVAGGRLTRYLGNYDDFIAATASRQAEAIPPPRAVATPLPSAAGAAGAAPAPAVDATPRPARPRARRGDEAERQRRAATEVRELRRRLDDVEGKIASLERRLGELGAALADPALYVDGARARAITGERKSIEEQVAWLLREWEDLSAALAAYE